MNERKNFKRFVNVQKGKVSYSEWRKETEEAALQLSKEELEDGIKKYEIDCRKDNMKFQLGKFGVCSYYVSLVVLFITTLASGIYSIYNTSNSVAISLMNTEQDRKKEAMDIIGKNISEETGFIGYASLWIFASAIIILGIFIIFKVCENYKVNKLLFFEEKIKILKEVVDEKM